MSTKKRTIPAELEEDRQWWISRSNKWKSIHYPLGIVGIVAALVGTIANTKFSGKFVSHDTSLITAWIAGVIATVCTSVVTFLGADAKSKAFAKASRYFDEECRKWLVSPDLHDKYLVEAYDTARKMIVD